MGEPGSGTRPATGTYQTCVSNYSGADWAAGDSALSAYGEIYGRVQRKLFADVAAGRSATSLKSAYLKQYGIPARLFNSVRASLEGKVASVREQQKLRAGDLSARIKRAEKQVACLLNRVPGTRFTRRNAGWLICTPGSRRWKPIYLTAGYGCALGPSGCGASSRISKPTVTPLIRNGSGTGKLPAAMSSSCWGAGMKRRDASCVWRPLPITAR